MDRFNVERFKSLENSILALRESNRSDSLRNDVKQRNLTRIQEYSDEIVNRLLNEKTCYIHRIVGCSELHLN